MEECALGSVDADRLAGSAGRGDRAGFCAPGCCRPARRRVRQPLPAVAELAAETGQGMHGVVEGERLWISRPGWVAVSPASPRLLRSRAAAPGGTVIALAGRGGWLGFRLGDSLRADAPMITRRLAAEGAVLGSLSGDAQPVVDAVAARLGIHDARGGLDRQGQSRRSSTCSATTGRSWR